MNPMRDYHEADDEAYLKHLHHYAIGHLCFECRRPLQVGEMHTIRMLGPMPIYYHSACLFLEDKIQKMLEDNIGNEGLIYD